VAPSGTPVVVTDPVSAELAKYASNCFLAMKLSYVNALAELCERTGADVEDVTAGMRLDPRIGPDFLRPGPGWGGSCLPKDTRAMLWAAESVAVDFPLLRATIATLPSRPASFVPCARRSTVPLRNRSTASDSAYWE
jgi:UDPglucose 6-dehydrogenase